MTCQIIVTQLKQLLKGLAARLQLYLLTFAPSSVVNVVFIGVTKHLDLVIFNMQV